MAPERLHYLFKLGRGERSREVDLLDARAQRLSARYEPHGRNGNTAIRYGGIGKAARNWECYERIVGSLRALEADESLRIQSGKPVGVFRTHADAPRVLIANSNLVPKWANWDRFHSLDRLGLMMYGQMTAGSWKDAGVKGAFDYPGFVPAYIRPLFCREVSVQPDGAVHRLYRASSTRHIGPSIDHCLPSQ